MIRSLYTAITGLKNHQISMDIIGNNIANVNTAGFKRERASFATMLGQEIRGTTAPAEDTDGNTITGGMNGISIGLGSILGSVDKVMGQGSSQYTGKATDIMIQGEGFFVLNTISGNVYTRVGNFDFDKEGNLVNVGTGAKVQGYKYESGSWPADPEDPAANLVDIKFSLGEGMEGDEDFKLQSFSIGQDGIVTGVYSDGSSSMTRPLYKIAVALFSNQSGLTPIGNNCFVESNNSGNAEIGNPGEAGRGTIMPNYLEMSNVDLSQEFTDMIVTQRGFQANARVITVSDTLLQELIDLKR